MWEKAKLYSRRFALTKAKSPKLPNLKRNGEPLDHQYSLSRQISSIVQAATYCARELDREFELGIRW
ncbi:hypothetical protein GOBAR_DD24368 [Gossypium barbadense]|nr:hypothetical protein GOBAR_DD24368 [Gossypium barbadense]